MRRLALLATFLVPVLAATPARGAQAARATVEALARASSLVLRGRVVGVTAGWTADRRRIFTSAEVSPTAVWRGMAAPRVTVLVPGGVVGTTAQRVDGAPELRLGEEVVLFLSPAEAGAYRITGLRQGAFEVSGPVARPDLASVSFVPSTPSPSERRSEAMSVAELERRVRSVP